ncbi:MAG: MazG family protein, partial [Actinomycetota bacterium]|nr:MazG family protein [Actinomycetota bacterium]
MTDGRLVLLACSPRVAPGLLGPDAWDVLRSAEQVWYGLVEHPQLPALHHAGVQAARLDDPPRALAQRLLDLAARGAVVVWLLDPAGDAALSTAITEALTLRAAAGTGTTPELELLAGSYDLPGAHLLDLVAVMDRLRSPGGCPWDAHQSHESLVRYLVEEAYELVEAIETGDRAHLREELGDVLLQVVFHARVAAEDPDEAFDVDDVADGIVTKLVSRHPHVFGSDATSGGESRTAEHVEATWDRLKTAEKGRTSVVDGIPPGLPALASAEKLLGRAARAGLDVPLPPTGAPTDAVGLGDTLLGVVA